MTPKNIIIVLVAIAVIVVAWAPWLSADDARSIVQRRQSFQEQHSVERKTENPAISVKRLPFCRWLTTYEGMWFVCFWERNSGSTAPLTTKQPMPEKY